MRASVRSAWTALLPRSPVFTTANAAAAAGVSIAVASRDLGLAERSGLIVRITRGVWAQQTHPDFSPYAAVPYIVSGQQYTDHGYVSLLSALSLRGMIQQMPGSVHVMLTTQRRPLDTPVARYEFHRIDAALFGGFSDYGTRFSFPLATPAKALFDTLLISVARGSRFSFLPELEFPKDFDWRAMEEWIGKIRNPRTRSAVRSRWEQRRP